ncbi:MAG TPA: ABC transporter permease [Solirubrobacteraceae bacterium]|nr:ABC transporter permease [Solirubrobacteraceae bacterium]
MTDALRAEWTKLRTVTATAWLLLAAIVLTVALGAGVAHAVSYSAAGRQDTTKLSLTGVYLGQAIVAILAVQAISAEYSCGMIRVTLIAIPRRPVVLAAKAAIVAALVLAAGAVAILGSVLAGRVILPAGGFTAAHGYAPLSLGHGATRRAAVGSVLYLALIALLSLGVAAAVREAAVAIGIVLALLYVFPVIAALIGDPHLQRRLEQIAPMSAGLAIQSTINLGHLPIAPWAGLGVLAAWAGAALIAGGVVLRLRDA